MGLVNHQPTVDIRFRAWKKMQANGAGNGGGGKRYRFCIRCRRRTMEANPFGDKEQAGRIFAILRPQQWLVQQAVVPTGRHKCSSNTTSRRRWRKNSTTRLNRLGGVILSQACVSFHTSNRWRRKQNDGQVSALRTSGGGTGGSSWWWRLWRRTPPPGSMAEQRLLLVGFSSRLRRDNVCP